jgi:hypothetical protein
VYQSFNINVIYQHPAIVTGSESEIVQRVRIIGQDQSSPPLQQSKGLRFVTKRFAAIYKNNTTPTYIELHSTFRYGSHPLGGVGFWRTNNEV